MYPETLDKVGGRDSLDGRDGVDGVECLEK